MLGTRTRFDYVKGRVLKVDLGKDELFTGGYNRDNGFNAAEDALAPLLPLPTPPKEGGRGSESH